MSVDIIFKSILFNILFLNNHFISGSNDAELVPLQRRLFDQDLYENVLDSELCNRHLLLLLNNTNTARALPFLDAGIRFPRGFLEGNTVDLGNYHQCLGIRQEYALDTLSRTIIEGKYCSISLPLDQELKLPEFPPWPEIQSVSLELMDMINEYRNIKAQAHKLTSIDNPDLRLSEVSPGLSSLALTLAICIPKTCTPDQALGHITGGVIQFHENYCRLPNDKPYVPADYVALSIFSVIGIFVLISTTYDLVYLFAYKKDPKEKNPLYSSFSVYTNTQRLLTFKSNPDALNCLDGIRALAIMWVMVGHTYNMIILYVVQNIIEVFEWTRSLQGLWIMAAPLSVDTFLMMSGLLSVYTITKKATRWKLLKSLHLFYLNRYLRIFPLLAAAILLQVSLVHRVGDGPEWSTVAAATQNCRDNWWLTLLHVQNYFNQDRMCIGQTWYLAVDMQLYLISPLVLVWLCAPRQGSGRRAGWCALTSAILISLIVATVYCFVHDFPVNTLSQPEEADRFMDYYYVNTLTRSPPFFIGMIYGYVLHLWRGKTIVLSKRFVLFMWTSAATLMCLVIYIHHPTTKGEYDNQAVDNLLNSYMRSIWALALGWLIFACVHGYGGPVNWFLSLHMWKLPARLSYAMYLLHIAPMIVINSMRISPIYFTQWGALFRFFGDLVLSFILAFILTLAVDSPFSTLQKIMFEGGQTKKQHESTLKNNDFTPEITNREKMESKTAF